MNPLRAALAETASRCGRIMMDSTHGASNPFAAVPESASLSQTTYFEADAPPEAESEESAYVSFTVLHPARASPVVL